jgi:hypothetical protein
MQDFKIGILLLQNINRSTTNEDASACFMGNKDARLFNNIRVGSFVRRECMGEQCTDRKEVRGGACPGALLMVTGLLQLAYQSKVTTAFPTWLPFGKIDQ